MILCILDSPIYPSLAPGFLGLSLFKPKNVPTKLFSFYSSTFVFIYYPRYSKNSNYFIFYELWGSKMYLDRTW